MFDQFDTFWNSYPRKTGKGKAREAFARKCHLTTIEKMLATLDWQRVSPQWLKNGGEFIPLPATWLNQERWDDEPTAQSQVSEKNTRSFTAVRNWASRG